MVRYLLLLAAALPVHGQVSSGVGVRTEGTQPKASAAEYPVRAESGNLAIGAEYTVHSFGRGEEMYVVEDYLVVEVALFPPEGERVTPDAGKFTLRVNGGKTLHAQNPAMVAGHMYRRERESHRTMTADAGIGGMTVGLGHPQRPDPVTGDPQGRRLPDPPRVPDVSSPVEPRQREGLEQLLVRSALPEETLRGPVSGFLYFPYEGKASKAKSLELLFQDVVLKLK